MQTTIKQKATQIGAKTAAVAIEHLPCCGISFATGFLPHASLFGMQLHALNHNPGLEFGMMVAAAVGCEYAFNHRFCRNAKAITGASPHFKKHDTAKRYALALSIGLASWGIHQKLFHHHHEEHPDQSAVAAPLPAFTRVLKLQTSISLSV